MSTRAPTGHQPLDMLTRSQCYNTNKKYEKRTSTITLCSRCSQLCETEFSSPF